MKSRQKGLTTVEFAISGAVALLVLIGCIEIGRMLFVWNTLGESTRRAARLAAVCPMNDPAIARNALLSATAGGTSSAILPGLTTAKIAVHYYNSTGGAATGYDDVQYVRVLISGFQHLLLIPYFNLTLNAPSFQTTVPTESLGYVPETQVRVCLGG